MSNITDQYINKEDLGKNLYRKKTYYTLCIEQDVLAKNQDEADNLFSDNGGINHDKINKDLTDANNGVETYMVDANYTDSAKTEYVAKVVYDDYDGLENAIENGDVELDTYALENDIITADGKVVDKEESPLDDLHEALNPLGRYILNEEKKPIQSELDFKNEELFPNREIDRFGPEEDFKNADVNNPDFEKYAGRYGKSVKEWKDKGDK